MNNSHSARAEASCRSHPRGKDTPKRLTLSLSLTHSPRAVKSRHKPAKPRQHVSQCASKCEWVQHCDWVHNFERVAPLLVGAHTCNTLTRCTHSRMPTLTNTHSCTQHRRHARAWHAECRPSADQVQTEGRPRADRVQTECRSRKCSPRECRPRDRVSKRVWMQTRQSERHPE